MTRSENEKWTSYYLSLVFAGIEPDEAAKIVADARAEQEAHMNGLAQT